MPSDRTRIASLVRGELAIANVSGRQLARDLDWTSDGTGRRLRGEVPFRAEELVVIARYLGIPATRFLEERPPSSSATPSGMAS